MGKPTMDNRYIKVGGHGDKLYITKNFSEKLFIELDLTDWLAAGYTPNLAALTVAGGGAMGTWSDAGANAPVATAGTHTATALKFALAAGNSSWNAGGAGGYGVNEGKLTIIVTAPTTGETKEIILVVKLKTP